MRAGAVSKMTIACEHVREGRFGDERQGRGIGLKVIWLSLYYLSKFLKLEM